MFKESQFRIEIVIPALKGIGLYSTEATELIIATIAQESHGGTYVEQLGPAHACGVIQMEEGTYNDIWNLYLKKIDPKTNLIWKYGQDLTDKIMQSCNFKEEPKFEELIYNLRLNIIMCRLHYLRFPDILPNAGDIDNIWLLYKRRYNTPGGGATKAQFLSNYRLFTGNPVRKSI